MTLVRLGDLDLTLPLAAAAFGWLAAARAWRTALWWGLLFGGGVMLVGFSKIAFMAWGSGLPALGFKSVSGHATGVTAVFPTVLYLLFHGGGPALRRAGVAAGLGLGLLVGALLVDYGFHSATEAVAGCVLGAAISLAWIRLAGPAALAPSPAMLCWFALAFLAGAWLMTFAHIGWWMIRLATLLSGNARPYPLGGADTCC
ncbi:membrane-associated phospholipid phosphatase [Massilia sp. RP-1-19]|uniref:Membrane-associated phospholipid phosphatase n=1 Tax=Massilia polaris TaxID=2728846 RepID=A0A848HJB2_9BURK|nr:membrane-associated phospholipid phosphatase [Massilia polaris]NML61946.1 membrane-associated phospholipid phosphatase [Massilia polaris]